jgi:hypothetical protein
MVSLGLFAKVSPHLAIVRFHLLSLGAPTSLLMQFVVGGFLLEAVMGLDES